MVTHDRQLGWSQQFVRVVARAVSPDYCRDPNGFRFISLSTTRRDPYPLVKAVWCAALWGQEWYRLFYPVPPITAPGGNGLL